jgi:hypothetical protein
LFVASSAVKSASGAAGVGWNAFDLRVVNAELLDMLGC